MRTLLEVLGRIAFVIYFAVVLAAFLALLLYGWLAPATGVHLL